MHEITLRLENRHQLEWTDELHTWTVVCEFTCNEHSDNSMPMSKKHMLGVPQCNLFACSSGYGTAEQM